MTTPILVVCPGRGSYDRTALGQLAGRGGAVDDLLDSCDRWREAHDRPSIRELDGAEAYRSSLHVAGEHASLLTFACSMADMASIDTERFTVVGVTGNSMGWYTAMAASGALPLEAAIELVDTMGSYQQRNVIGGQVLYPCHGDGRLESPSALQAIDQALQACATAGHVAEWSIHLGGYAVLGADREGVKALLSSLPPITRGARTFPVQLPLHSAFHTSLLEPTAARAAHDLAHLRPEAPRVPLVDGRGMVWRPRWADPGAMWRYTLTHQVTRPYDFTTAIRTALRYTGAELVVALGPGNSLGGPLSRILTHEGWRGLRTSADLAAAATSGAPALLSFGVPAQRERLLP